MAYRKLWKKFFSPLVQTTLWEGDDHILWVEQTMAREQYKRFYYNDIQAVMVVKSSMQQLWSAIWGTLAAISAIVAVSVSGTPIASSFFAALFLLLAFINLLKGACCKTYLVTAVQRERVRSLGRVKKAFQVMDKIRDLVEKEQGPLTASHAEHPPLALQPTGPGPGAAEPGTVPNTHAAAASAMWSRLFFSGLSIMGIAGLLHPILPHPLFRGFDIFGLMALFVLSIAVLVRQRGGCHSTALIACTWLALVLIVVQGICAYAAFTMAILQNPGDTYNTVALIKTFLGMLSHDNPLISSIMTGFGISDLVLGLGGLTLMMGKGR